MEMKEMMKMNKKVEMAPEEDRVTLPGHPETL
jgi:LDH2 family malate/lactate/ureidoglycolate dehydrogenase